MTGKIKARGEFGSVWFSRDSSGRDSSSKYGGVMPLIVASTADLVHARTAEVARVRRLRRKGAGIRRIARELGVGVGTVLRVTAQA
jgi:helix-turn-helix resolvase-like protein